MKYQRHIIYTVFLVAFAVFLLQDTSHIAYAAFNQEINYQGKLTNGSNVAVADGSYNVRFKLYTVATGGAAIWTETWCYSPDSGSTCDGTGTNNRITITNGLFSTLLGSTTAIASVDFNQTLYLGIEIGGSGTTPSWDGEMTPRKRLGAVPAAFEAGKLGGLNNTQFLRTDATNSTSTATTFVTLNQTGAGAVLDLTNGTTNILRALSTGNVGIGTTSPYSKLTVWGGGTGTGQSFEIVNNASTTLAKFLDNGTGYFLGNIGIGTTSPYAKLSVVGETVSQYFTATSTTATSTFANAVVVGTTSPLTSTASADLFVASKTGNPNLQLVANSAGSATFSYYRDTTLVGQIFGGSTFNIDAASGGVLYLQRNNSGHVVTNNTGGNLGVGTSSPYAKLSVVGETVSAYYTATTTATSTFAGGLRIGTGGQPGALSLLGNATSTFAQGVDISAGCFAINGTCVGGGGGSGTVTSVATNNGLTGGTITTSGTIGLNTAGFLTNGLLTWDGSNLVATGTPALTAGYFIATSTTATSTFAGDVAIGASGTTGSRLTVTKTSTDTVAGSEHGSKILITDTGVTTSGNDNTFGQRIDVTRTGASGANTNTYGVYATVAGDNSGGGAGATYGSLYSVTGTTGDDVYGNYTLTASGATNAYGSLTIVSGVFGAVTNGYGLSAGGGTNGLGITNLYGVDIANGSMATNARGLNINDQGSGSTDYSIYTAGTKSYFGGNVGISTTSPWTNLSVSGSSDLGNFGLAGYFTATSTTATSTFAGAFGIGTTTPTSRLTLAASALGGILINTWTNITNAFTIKNNVGDTVFNVDTTATSPILGIGTSTPYSRFSVWGGGTNGTEIVNFSNNASTTLFSVLENGRVIIPATTTVGALTVTNSASTTATAPIANTLYKENIVKGWVAVRGGATPAISGSFNVSSITDSGVGLFSVNWQTAFANANYAVAGSASGTSCSTADNCYVSTTGESGVTTSAVALRISDDASAPRDADWWSIMAIGQQ